MAFATGNLDDHRKIGSGENYGQGIVLTDATFENGLVAGRFAKSDSGSIDLIDASSTPVIAGVVLRDPTLAVEDGEAYDAALYTQISYQRHGLITVQAVSGQTPVLFEAIFVENQTPSDYGKATVTASGNADANAEFIQLVDGTLDVWQIRLK